MKIPRLLLLVPLLALVTPSRAGEDSGARVDGAGAHVQISIPLIEAMPAVPQPFQIIDWKARARGFDRLAFDESARGEFLPLVRVSPPEERATVGGFVMPAYVGMTSRDSQAITALAALVSGSLVGAERTRPGGRDWVQLGEAWFQERVGLVLNDRRGSGGSSYWYDVLPGVLFCQLADRHPENESAQRIVRTLADGWREVVKRLGGANADFNHTAFSFAKREPVQNGQWSEPDAAAGIGWISYMAWTRFRDPRHLEAARWCLDFLERRPPSAGNPLYEVLLYYAPVLAARWNAEQGHRYDVRKLVDWCLSANSQEGAARPAWGVLGERFGGYDVHGLQGSTRPGDGYAFAMNSFQAAAALAPLARYDDRYARSLGRWLLHVANNARLFYPDALPAELQQPPHWKGDPDAVIPYEGLRHHTHVATLPEAEVKTRPAPEAGGLEQRWEFAPPAAVACGRLEFLAEGEVPAGSVALSVAPNSAGPWQQLLLFPHRSSTGPKHKPHGAQIANLQGWERVFLKLETVAPQPGANLSVKKVRWEFETPQAPFAMGDPPLHQWGAQTGRAVYGGAHAGYLAALVERTNEPHVLQLDLLATDWCHPPAYPTFLYYNPDSEPRRVKVRVGPEPRDLYDSVSDRFLVRGVNGEAEISLPPDRVVVAVVTPADGQLTRRANRMLIDGIVVDERALLLP
jgi:hypothetical protein